MTKMLPGYKHIPQENRLTKLRLLKLQPTQLRGDLIEVLKIINRFDDASFQHWFQCAHSGQGHSCKIEAEISSKCSFSNRVIIRLEARLQPNIGFTFDRALTMFTCSGITPPKVNRFGWNLEHLEYTVCG